MSKYESTVLKGAAIIMMFVHHLFYSVDTWKGYELTYGLLSETRLVQLATICKICVSIFVFVSAYGISKQLSSLEDKKIASKTCSRIVKLIMSFMFVFGVSQIFGLFDHLQKDIYGEISIESVVYFIIDSLGFANAVKTPSFNATWWYMPLAFFIIAIMPLLWKFAKKAGSLALLLIVIIVPSLLNFEFSANLIYYGTALALGIAFANNNLFEKLKRMSNNKGRMLLIIIGAFCGIFVFSYIRLNMGLLVHITNGFFVVAIALICVFVLGKIPGIRHILHFLGTHSMNMFLIHTFIYYYCFKEIYLLKNPIIITVVLLVISAVISVGIDALRKVTRYDLLIKKVGAQVEGV